MKLRYLLPLPLFAALLVGCDDIESSDALPVENPQLPMITTGDFSVTPSSALTNGLNLESLVAQADASQGSATESTTLSRAVEYTEFMVDLYTITVSESALPEGSTVSGGFQISETADFAEFEDVEDLVFNEGKASVSLQSLLNARTNMFGKDPGSYTIYYRIPVYVNISGGEIRIGDSNYYYNNGSTFTEVGVDPGYTVETTYYLLGPGGSTIDDLIELEHDGTTSVWDNPVFSVRISPAADCEWQLVPESAVLAATNGSLDASLLYGPAVASESAGVLVLGGDPGTLEAGKYDVTIDMSTLSYSIDPVLIPEWLGTPNDSQGWDSESSQKLALYNETYFLGYAWFGGTWGGKLTTDEGTWCGIDNPMEYDATTGVYTGVLNVGGGGNINEGVGPELYFFNVEWTSLEFSMTQVTAFGVVGDVNGWNADAPIALTPSADYLTWEGDVTFSADGGYKFIANTGWSLELGAASDGSASNLICTGGGNINATAGTYHVVLDLTSLPYSATLTAK